MDEYSGEVNTEDDHHTYAEAIKQQMIAVTQEVQKTLVDYRCLVFGLLEA